MSEVYTINNSGRGWELSYQAELEQLKLEAPSGTTTWITAILTSPKNGRAMYREFKERGWVR